MKDEKSIYKKYARKYSLSWTGQENSYFVFLICPISNLGISGVSGRMDPKLKQKNFPALISIYVSHLNPSYLMITLRVSKSESSRDVLAATSLLLLCFLLFLCMSYSVNENF